MLIINNMKKVIYAVISFVPVLASAAITGVTTLVGEIGAIIRSLIPIMFALAVVYFLYGMFEFIANSVANNIGKVALESNIPVIFGVITTENLEQAIERAGSKAGNKGWEAALAAIEMVNLSQEL